jgi:hypothetical protein
MMTRRLIAILPAILVVAIWSAMASAQATTPTTAPAEPALQPAQEPSTHPGEHRQFEGRMEPGRRHGPMRPGRQEVSEEQEKQIMEFLSKHMKEHYDRLEKMREENPHAYRRSLAFLWPRVQQLLAMPEEARQAHVKEANLRVEIFRTARAYQEAGDAQEKENKKAELQNLLAEKFDAEQQVREYRLKKIQEQIDRLKNELQERLKDRDKVIQEQLEWWLKQRPGDRRRPERGGPPGCPPGGPSGGPLGGPANRPPGDLDGNPPPPPPEGGPGGPGGPPPPPPEGPDAGILPPPDAVL